jgi:O-antigen ligase
VSGASHILWFLPWQRLQLAALTAMAALLPFYRFGLSVGGQNLAPHELLLAAAGCCALAASVARGTSHPPLPSPVRERRDDGFSAYDLPITLFLAAALLSLLATEYLRLSLRELRTLIVEPLLFWYLCRLTVKDVRDVGWLVGALLAATTAVALIGLGQWVFGGAVTEVQGVRRVLGTYSSPNHFALLLGRALPFLLALAWCVPRWRPWAAGGFLVCAAALGATFSVGGWLGTGLALLVVGGLVGGRRLVLALIMAGVVASTAVFVAAPVERLVGRLDPRQGTSFVRVQLWQAAAQLVVESPLLGIGLDNFLYRYPALMPEETVFEPNLSHPHNLILQFWLQLGLLGLLALGWLLWLFWRQVSSAAVSATGPPLARAAAWRTSWRMGSWTTATFCQTWP